MFDSKCWNYRHVNTIPGVLGTVLQLLVRVVFFMKLFSAYFLFSPFIIFSSCVSIDAHSTSIA